MEIDTPESTSDGDEKHKGSETDDGDFQLSDESKDPRNDASSPVVPKSPSISNLPSAIDGHKRQMEDDVVSQNEIEDQISPSEWKRKGNVYFGKEDWDRALHAYHSGLTALLEERRLSLEEESHGDNVLETAPSLSATTAVEFISGSVSAANPLEVALRSNMAFVLLKLQQYNRAEEECNQLLAISPANSKGMVSQLYMNGLCLEWFVALSLLFSSFNF